MRILITNDDGINAPGLEVLQTIAAEVAEILGCSPATVRNHVFQARKALRSAIRERFPEYLPASERG